jgi:ribose 1,5-bisphosphokinase
VSEIGHARRAARAADQVGPGRLLLVVGPSGAGKDTLIAGARTACARDANVVFPRRVVTRPPSPAEDHDALGADAFAQELARGAFALWWEAYGNRYAIPASIDLDIDRGRTAVCNVSRTIIKEARRRYSRVTVVLVTAPESVLQARLAHRERASDGDIGRRLARSGELSGGDRPDFVIENVGPPDAGIRELLNVIRDPPIGR